MEKGFETIGSIMTRVLDELVKNSTRTATAVESSPGLTENRGKKAEAPCGIFYQLQKGENLRVSI